MADSTITALTTAVSVSSVQNVIITSSDSDGNGGFIRAIKIYGLPAGVSGSPVFTLVLTSDTQDKISVHTGDLTF